MASGHGEDAKERTSASASSGTRRSCVQEEDADRDGGVSGCVRGSGIGGWVWRASAFLRTSVVLKFLESVPLVVRMAWIHELAWS